MTRSLALGSLAVLVPRVALACPVCFGAADGPMLQGSNMGILALLIVTLTMLGGFAAFFWMLARRAARAEEVQAPQVSGQGTDALAAGGVR